MRWRSRIRRFRERTEPQRNDHEANIKVNYFRLDNISRSSLRRSAERPSPRVESLAIFEALLRSGASDELFWRRRSPQPIQFNAPVSISARVLRFL